MARVIKSIQAETDLDDLWLYIAQDNSAAADRLLDNIEAQCRLVATQPHMGRKRDELAAGLRIFPVGRYIVFYKILKEGEEGVEIVRILHGARDSEIFP